MTKTPSTDDLDLHGYTVAEAIELFVQHYNAFVDCDQFGCFKVIHSYGSSGEGGAKTFFSFDTAESSRTRSTLWWSMVAIGERG